jgi:hypothetical protein
MTHKGKMEGVEFTLANSQLKFTLGLLYPKWHGF